MGDEALNAYLDWLDKCAKEQETDYETWLEGRVAQLEEELATSMAYADKLAAGLPDGMLPKDVEVLRKANHGLVEENAALSELLSPLVDVELERDKLKETIDALIAVYDLTQRDVEKALKKWGGEGARR